LNYAYAVLERQVRMQIIADGYDPTIGFLHTYGVDRPALVFDLMEPQRPIVDRKVLEFVQAQTFHPADFTMRSDGVCRLNRRMAKLIVQSGISIETKYPNILTFVPSNPKHAYEIAAFSDVG
jgi:CRISPR-associated protein Cas1